MKKRLLFAALFSAALVSCTKDQVVEVQQDEIKFRVATENATKANDVYCENNSMGTFELSADYNPTSGDKQLYITDDQYSVDRDTKKATNESGVNYWPNEGSLDFYAWVNAGTTYNRAEDATRTFTSFSPDGTVGNQVDLMYAVAAGKTKSANADAGVTLNFRHALSQIVFAAKNQNANIYVEIYGVTVGNVLGVNTFTFPTNSTNDNLVDHDQNNNVTIQNQGTWAQVEYTDDNFAATKLKNYSLSLTGEDIAKLDITSGTEVSADISAKNDDTKEYSSKAMLLLPQTIGDDKSTTAWNPKVVSDAKPGEQTGSYILLNCKIWNKSGDTYSSTNDILLWNGNIALPYAFNWEQGKKYTYTFIFTKEGNGGYNPEDGKEVLTPIQLAVTVDDFVLGSNDNNISVETLQ